MVRSTFVCSFVLVLGVFNFKVPIFQLVESTEIDHKDLTRVIWGSNVKQDVFERWSQGFIFDNKNEPTALLQYSGGPCSIIATVQGFLLRELLFESKCGDNWQKPSGRIRISLLLP